MWKFCIRLKNKPVYGFFTMHMLVFIIAILVNSRETVVLKNLGHSKVYGHARYVEGITTVACPYTLP